MRRELATRRFIVSSGLTAAILTGLGVRPASAQQVAGGQPPAVRSFRGLFGGVSSGTERDASALAISITESYDDNLLGDVAPVTEIAQQQSGFYTGLTADLNYHAGSGDLQFAATGSTNIRYFPSEDRVYGVGHSAGAGVSARFGQRTTLLANQTVSYMPSYLYQLFATPAPPQLGESDPASNYAIDDQRSLNYGTSANLTHELGPRDSLSFLVSGRYTDYIEPGARLHNLSSYEAGGSYAHSMTRNLRFRTGYTFRRSELQGVIPTEHGVNVGFDYGRPISPTRRMTFSFALGSTLLNGPVPGAVLQDVRPQYRLIGDVSVGRQFGRTWESRAAYHRGVGYIEGLTTPVASEGFTATTTGMLSRGLDIELLAAYSKGEPTAPTLSRQGFTTYTASVRTRFALTSKWATYVEYLYYYYDFSSQVMLAANVPLRVSRNGVHVGLMWWIPFSRRP